MPQPALVEPLRRWDPEEVGGYVLLGRLGAGAMGQVYLGRSPAGRLVAVKTIKTELAEEADFRTRFGQEVAAARRVSGAFTAAVVAADSEADVPWLATVYVPAPSLSRLVRACGPLPAGAVCWLAAGCAEALEAIHGVGLVHRDLKPSNVLVSPDGPRVIDFGVARAAERIQLTVTRGSIGTPAYMAPEQARDTRQATAASDVFSLGATMLFAATGHAPYQGETVIDVLVRLATEPPDLTGLPRELTDLVVGCLDRDPRSRPTAASIVARLAPGLATGDELGEAPLPAAALRLIAEYRRAPAEPTPGGGDPGEETTLGSQPLLPSHSAQPDAAALAADTDPRAAAIRRSPARRASSPGSSGFRRFFARHPEPDASHPVSRARRAVLAGGGAAVAAALLGTGWAVGTSVADDNRPIQLGPVIQPPPAAGSLPATGSLPAGTAPALALGRPGTPIIAVSQPTGDPNTIFIVHGQGWPAGTRVTVTLLGVGASPIRPIVDDAGMFNYAINQDHEFFAGGLPPGVYTVRVTGRDGMSSQASFEVLRG